MTRHTNAQTAPAFSEPKCMRCGGPMPDGGGYYHLDSVRCIEALRRRSDVLERLVLRLAPEHLQREFSAYIGQKG